MVESYSTVAYTVMWMNLEDIVLRETSRSEGKKHLESLLTGGTYCTQIQRGVGMVVARD